MTITLAVPPTRANFRPQDDVNAYANLEAELKSQADNTELFSVGRALDANVWKDGLIQGKYKLTTTALGHLCSRLCSGLYQLVNELAMGAGEADATDDTVTLAINTINQVINVYYRRVDGCSWVIDHRTKRIEGLVGRKYRFVSNWELVQKAKDYVLASSKASRPEFAEALLYGRRMIVRFKDRQPAFALDSQDGPDLYYGGFHFANSEVGGYAIRAATMVLRRNCDNKAVSPFQEGGKLAHLKGKKFDRRFAELLEGVTLKAERLKKFKDSLMRMRATKLGLGGTQEQHVAAVKSISKQLRSKGLTAKFAETVIEHVITQGSYPSQRLRTGRSPLIAASTRTLYDLFNAVTMQAKQLEFGGQEEAEQVAYMMMGK